MSGKEKGAIKAKLKELKIPEEIIKELLPTEEGAGEAKKEKPSEETQKKKE